MEYDSYFGKKFTIKMRLQWMESNWILKKKAKKNLLVWSFGMVSEPIQVPAST